MLVVTAGTARLLSAFSSPSPAVLVVTAGTARLLSAFSSPSPGAAALPIQLGYTAPRLLPGTTPFSEIRSQDTGSSGPSLLVVAAAVWRDHEGDGVEHGLQRGSYTRAHHCSTPVARGQRQRRSTEVIVGLVRVCGLCFIVVSDVVASVVVSTCLAPRCVHHVAATANVVCTHAAAAAKLPAPRGCHCQSCWYTRRCRSILSVCLGSCCLWSAAELLFFFFRMSWKIVVVGSKFVSLV